MRIQLLVLCVVSLFVTSLGIADVVPGRWEKVDQLQAGSPLILELVTGDRIECAFFASNPEELTIETNDGKRQTIPKTTVTLVSRLQPRKARAVLGMAVGAGAGVGTGLAISSQFDETFFARADLMALTCGAIGALTGALIGNALSKPAGQEVVFRSK